MASKRTTEFDPEQVKKDLGIMGGAMADASVDRTPQPISVVVMSLYRNRSPEHFLAVVVAGLYSASNVLAAALAEEQRQEQAKNDSLTQNGAQTPSDAVTEASTPATVYCPNCDHEFTVPQTPPHTV
jgi:hypothetical protein